MLLGYEDLIRLRFDASQLIKTLSEKHADVVWVFIISGLVKSNSNAIYSKLAYPRG